MECNRDEAIRSKSIAEGKLEKKDFAAAKKFALKAQTLYPGLEGLSQILTTLDVYISAENKVSGEVDWYGVLGVNPSADDETIRKQYRKLALMLHPDKNKCAGAEGAFKLLSEAWSLLSDKAKRLAYNQRRSIKGFQQKVPLHTGGPSVPPRANGFHNFANRTSVPKTQNNAARMASSSVHQHQRTDTFWTICHRCKMHYEYLKIYLNNTLLCPNCQEAFLASETPPPFNYSKSASRQRQQPSANRAASYNLPDMGRNSAAAKTAGPGQAGLGPSNYASFQRDVPSRMVGVCSTDASIAAKAANVVQQAHQRMKRERDEGQAAAGWEGNHVYSTNIKGEMSSKKSRMDNGVYNYGESMATGNGGFSFAGPAGSRKNILEPDKSSSFPGICRKPNSTRELTPVEIRNMLMEKARKEILKKLNEWSSGTVIEPADTETEKVKEGKKEKERNFSKNLSDTNGKFVSSGTGAEQAGKRCSNTSVDDAAAASMNVPDPDFHNFDLDRTENSFGDNEVWAAYDDVDGMPRFYAMINKVMSRKPFKLRISWLNSKTNSEFGPLEWVASGFYKTCGEFRVGRYETSKSINSFSHKVKWSKGPRGTVHIFPRKGDVWALYRHWSPDWNESTPDDVIHKYDMVLVLDDYNEEQGVPVAPLIKVAGFRTVFRSHVDTEKVKRIPKEEMFRFSHQVPNHLLTGEEAQNVPIACQELDPAATPVELLQLSTEVGEEPVMENGGDNCRKCIKECCSI